MFQTIILFSFLDLECSDAADMLSWPMCSNATTLFIVLHEKSWRNLREKMWYDFEKSGARKSPNQKGGLGDFIFSKLSSMLDLQLVCFFTARD